MLKVFISAARCVHKYKLKCLHINRKFSEASIGLPQISTSTGNGLKEGVSPFFREKGKDSIIHEKNIWIRILTKQNILKAEKSTLTVNKNGLQYFFMELRTSPSCQTV